MFIWFNKNKFNYEKGQLAPIFIVVLVIVMIMAMVTINLSKVSLIKTDSANAVDSGALAGGSVMANVFNSIAQTNGEMEFAYWSFFTAVSVSFVIALINLISANASLGIAEVAYGAAQIELDVACGCYFPCLDCCNWPCVVGCACCVTWIAMCIAAEAELAVGIAANELALSAIGYFIATTWAISISVTGYWLAQYYFYLLTRDMASQGRENAIKIAHRFTFMNSGIGSKLKEGSPPSDISDAIKKNNYREEFTTFLNNIGSDTSYAYSWRDGEDRSHSASSQVSVDEVDTFDLKVTILPYPAELALLAGILTEAYIAEAAARAASISADEALGLACASPCAAAVLAGAAFGSTTAALASIPPLFILLIASYAGLAIAPWTFTSSSDSDALPFIICWIDDVVHDRRFRVDTNQSHEGADLGLWQTRYPNTHSYSIVDFRGKGQIHEPVLKHDASVVETDR